NGPSRTGCTGSATSPTAKTPPGCAPATPPESWPACATSPSAHYASPDTPTPPPPCAPSPATPNDHSPSTESPTDTQNDFAGPLPLRGDPRRGVQCVLP